MIEHQFYLVAAYGIATLNFAGFACFYVLRSLLLHRQIERLEQHLADKN